MRVLVCGGRNFQAFEFVYETLDEIHGDGDIDTIIEGGARGADEWARIWAREASVKLITVPADWDSQGKAAGPIRNQRMVDDFKPDLVVAFPGGRGTADMVRRAKAAGIKVMKRPVTTVSTSARPKSLKDMPERMLPDEIPNGGLGYDD